MLHLGGSVAYKASGCRLSWRMLEQCPAVPMSPCTTPSGRDRRALQARRRADRLSSLEGARIAFLWDYLFRGDELFPVLGRASRTVPGVDIVGYDVFGNLHGSDQKARRATAR